jgi:hypothetical protein
MTKGRFWHMTFPLYKLRFASEHYQIVVSQNYVKK